MQQSNSNAPVTAPRNRTRRVWRSVRQLAVTSAVLAGAVAWTSSINTPWRGQSAADQLSLRPLIVRPLSDTQQVLGVARLLERHTNDHGLASRIASALVSEARKKNIEPSLLVGVVLTENFDLDPKARSKVGARGLMQVMPFHRGHWGCESARLDDVEGNICHGVKIMADLMKRSPSTETALLRYNGCVNGTNTPNCASYPRIVLRRAAQASEALLALATSDTGRAPMIR